MRDARRIRLSVGTAAVMNLLKLRSDAQPTTAYLMTYGDGSCRGNCGFCPQAMDSTADKDLLSRVVWPDFDFDAFMENAVPSIREGKFRRLCIQALNYPNLFDDVSQICSSILSKVNIPISVSCPPMTKVQMENLRKIGVERIGIPLDAATEQIFEKTKGSLAGGPYRWPSHFATLENALEVFGRNKVSTHLMVGLGETEREMAEIVQRLSEMGVTPGLFALTPIEGTRLGASKSPEIGHYRRVQVARFLITQKMSSAQLMKFDLSGRIIDFGITAEVLQKTISLGHAFRTSGCPDCNRPFYNESPRGPIYNYPRDLNHRDRLNVLQEMQT